MMSFSSKLLTLWKKVVEISRIESWIEPGYLIGVDSGASTLPASCPLRRSPDRGVLRRPEHDHLPEAALLVQFPLAIAAPRRLGYGIEASQCAVDDWKVDIDSCLDELGAHEPQCIALGQSCLDRCDDHAAVLGAHQGGEMDRACRQKLVETAAIFPRIDDAENAVYVAELTGDLFPGNGILALRMSF